MRQIIYKSVTTNPRGHAEDDAVAITRQALLRNGLDGITGLLYTQGTDFLQVIEGPDDSIADLLASLLRDPRHRDLRVLVDRETEDREFGDWMMLHRERRETVDAFDRRLHALLLDVSHETASYFRALMPA
ncbi:BLUF domain-containing protein [Sphingomonas sp.]|uniref:BLUF domain-containing protein n=1 Tax=Sphingomonas sp. TaxID=28214 RepID=UPI00333E6093